jgi:hypothetical protein
MKGAAPLNTLLLLPEDVVGRILRCLSAADLTRCSSACRMLNRLASAEALWRRLYCFRWGIFQGGESKIMHANFWKVHSAAAVAAAC